MKSFFVFLVLFLYSGGWIANAALPSSTNWNSISTNLLQYYSSNLPTIPAQPLPADLTGYTKTPFTNFTLSGTQIRDNWCGQALNSTTGSFPDVAVEYGGQSIDGTNACRVLVNTLYGIDYLVLRNKNVDSSSTPVTADPSWVQFRYPVPDSSVYGIPTTIVIDLDDRGGSNSLTAFGGNPCTNPANPPNCSLQISGPWDRSVDAGYYVLLSTPGAGGYIINGPFLNDPVLNLPVPADLRLPTIKEIDVVVLTFNTYPSKTECTTSCSTPIYKSIRIEAVTLMFGITLGYNTQPSVAHPRLHGNNTAFWNNRVLPFFTLACDAQAGIALGSVRSTREDYENILFGGNICKNTRVTILKNHPVAKEYYTAGGVTFDTPRGYRRNYKGRNMFYLIRFLRICLGLGRTDCVYTQAELDDFVPRVINSELALWDDWGEWYTPGYVDSGGVPFMYDIYTKDPLRFWATFYDTFYNDLNTTMKTMITDKMDARATNFTTMFRDRAWPVTAGDNWVPWEISGLFYYTVTRWYESPLANLTLLQGLESLYRVRKWWPDDGSYLEGLADYSTIATEDNVESDYLLQGSFGIHTYAMPWEYYKKMPQWIFDSIAADGYTMTFSDSIRIILKATSALYAMYASEILGQGPASPDPCLVKQFWNEHFVSSGFDVAYNFHPIIAKVWSPIVSQCTALPNSRSAVYPGGGQGVFKRRIQNSTTTQTRLRNVDFNSLILEAKINNGPHCEMDFGSFIFSAYGSRIFEDLGYGTISNNAGRVSELDNMAGGANTVVIEEAWDTSNITNKSQFVGQYGTINLFNITNGGITYPYFKLDGSIPYGKTQSTGWLKRFFRYGISLPNGHYLLMDSLTKHSRFDVNDTLTMSEYFYSPREATLPTTCAAYGDTFHTNVTLLSTSSILIRPLCNNIFANLTTTVGLVAGASLSGSAKFVYDGVLTYKVASGIDPYTAFKSRFTGVVKDPEVRVMLLTSAKQQSSLPVYSIAVVTTGCPANRKCFEVKIAGNSDLRIELISDSDGYTLSCLSTKVSGSYVACGGSGTTTTTSTSTTTATSSTTTTTSTATTATTATSTSSTATSTTATSSTSSSTNREPSSGSIVTPSFFIILFIYIIYLFI